MLALSKQCGKQSLMTETTLGRVGTRKRRVGHLSYVEWLWSSRRAKRKEVPRVGEV